MKLTIICPWVQQACPHPSSYRIRGYCRRGRARRGETGHLALSPCTRVDRENTVEILHVGHHQYRTASKGTQPPLAGHTATTVSGPDGEGLPRSHHNVQKPKDAAKIPMGGASSRNMPSHYIIFSAEKRDIIRYKNPRLECPWEKYMSLSHSSSIAPTSCRSSSSQACIFFTNP